MRKPDTKTKRARQVLWGLSGMLALGLSLPVQAESLSPLTRFALESPAYATRLASARLLPYWDAWLLGPVSQRDGNDSEAPAASGSASAPAAAKPAPTQAQPASEVPSAAVIPKPSAKAWLYISKKSQRIYLKDVAPGASTPDAKPDTTLASWPVSTARYSLSTPVGRFRIISQVPDPPYSGRHGYYKPKDPRNPLGSRWMGLNVGHFRTGVPIGIHGTNEPDKIGQAVSDGCVRLRNADVETLFKLARLSMPVVISNQ